MGPMQLKEGAVRGAYGLAGKAKDAGRAIGPHLKRFGLGFLKLGGWILTKAIPLLLKGIFVILTSKIALIVGAIVGLGYLIWKFWKPISGFFKKLWQGILNLPKSIARWVGNFFSWLLPDWAKNLLGMSKARGEISSPVSPAGTTKEKMDQLNAGQREADKRQITLDQRKHEDTLKSRKELGEKLDTLNTGIETLNQQTADGNFERVRGNNEEKPRPSELHPK
jgi:hypothetical protein